MKRSEAIVATANGAKYMKQLCRHWGHKYTVEFDDRHGRIELPQTVCGLDAKQGELMVVLEMTVDADQMRMEAVVEEHIKRFAFKEELVFAWSRQSEVDGGLTSGV